MAIFNNYRNLTGSGATSGAVKGTAVGATAPIYERVKVSPATGAGMGIANTNSAGAATGAVLGAIPQTGRIVDDLTYSEPVNNTSGGNYSGGGYVQAPAYDPSQAYADAYAARQRALDENYQAALGQLKNSYNASVNDLRAQGDEALRQAYINMMMNKRGISQDLEAAGLTGGATESAMARLYNNYANDRNAIARQVDQSLTQMGNNYGNNVANLGMNYNTNYADAVADYQNQLASARQSMANTLARTSSNSRGTTTQTNKAATAANSMTGMTPMQAYRYVNSRQDLTDEEKANALVIAGYDLNEIADLIDAANNGAAVSDRPMYANGAYQGAINGVAGLLNR